MERTWGGREDRLPPRERWMWRSSFLAVKLKAVKASLQQGVRVGKARPKAAFVAGGMEAAGARFLVTGRT